MREQYSGKKNYHVYIYGIAAFILYSFSLLIGHYEESFNNLYMYIKAGFVTISAFYFLFISLYELSDRFAKQYAFLGLIILIYQTVLFAAVGQTIMYIRDYPAILNSIIWISSSLYVVIRYRNYLFSWIKGLIKSGRVRTLFVSSTIIALIVILLSAEPDGVMFTWDSDTLYHFIHRLDYESLYDSRLMSFHSHVSVVYAHILVLLKLLFKDIRIAYFLLNSLCILVASYGTTAFLYSILPGQKTVSYILADAMFMFSPWVCGLSTYHMYDYYIWTLFPLLIYYAYKRNWTGYIIIGALITFSKASGLIVFGSVCAGIVVSDVVDYLKSDRVSGEGKKENIIVSTAFHLFSNIKYWYFISIAFMFIVFFKDGIARQTQFEDTRFGIDISHIAHQIKMFSTANFLWIFMVLTILLIVRIYSKNRNSTIISDRLKSIVLVMLVSDVCFILFNCLCITYRIPRYMNSHISVLFLCSALFLLLIENKYISYTLMSVICVIMIISSFRMVDPVSKTLFDRINVGDHDIVDFEMTESPALGDSIICNREYYSYEALLDKALTYVIEDRSLDNTIMFSLGNNNLSWGFSGGRYSYGFDDNKRNFDVFYDKSKGGLANGYSYEYYDDPQMIPFSIRYIFPQESVSDAVYDSDSNKFYYIYMPTLNCKKESEVYDSFEVTEEKEFDFRGWKMICIKFAAP